MLQCTIAFIMNFKEEISNKNALENSIDLFHSTRDIEFPGVSLGISLAKSLQQKKRGGGSKVLSNEKLLQDAIDSFSSLVIGSSFQLRVHPETALNYKVYHRRSLKAPARMIDECQILLCRNTSMLSYGK